MVLQTIKGLCDLQEIDIRIRRLEKDHSQYIPTRLKEIDTLLLTTRNELTEEQNQLADAEMSCRMLESDLKSEKEKIKKWKTHLSEIKNNRDYQALSREIEAARKANLGIEDEILRKMQEIEDLRLSIDRKQEDFTHSEKKLTNERDQLKKKLAFLDERITEENFLRNKAASSLSDFWLQTYTAISKRRNGVAIVPVEGEYCQGCHMHIPPQLYNIVLTNERIEVCPFCHRILYYKQAQDTNKE